MATRPDKAPSELEASDYILHLWKRRWVILGFCAATMVLTYLGLRLFHPNMFESRALVMVRAQPRTTNLDIEKEGIAPPSFKSMFTADETIIFLRNQYNQMVENGTLSAEEGHTRITSPLEKYRVRFKVESVTEVDTTIATEFSPVMELRIRGESRGQTKVMADLWVNLVMNRFGNLMAEEAAWRLEVTRAKASRLGAELAEAVERREALADERMFSDSMMASLLRRLTSAPLPEAITYAESDILPYNVYSGPRQTRSDLKVDMSDARPGLLEELGDLERAIALADGDGDDAAMAAEYEYMSETVSSIRDEYRALSGVSSDLKAKLAELDAEITRLQYALRVNAGNAADAEAFFAAVATDAEGNETHSTLRVISRPIVPDLRVWPKRTLIAGIAAAALFAMLLVVFCAECYMRQAILFDSRSSRSA